MATFEVEVIPWHNEGRIKPILEEHIVHVRSGPSKGADRLLMEGIDDLLGDHSEWFITHLFSIVGMEVEGQEISLGLLYFKGAIPLDMAKKFKSAKLGRWVNLTETKKLHFGLEGFNNYRKIVRRVRSDLIGWVPGRYLEPVLVLTGEQGAPRVKDIKILLAKNAITRTAHELYKDLTSFSSDSFVVWIKPAGSIRIYRKGALFGQIMRLRDAGGWTTRHLERIVEIVEHLSKSAGIHIDSQTCRKWIIEPSISMSESRKGCTIVVMEKKTFNDLESRWQQEEVSINELESKCKHKEVTVACRAKHAPITLEQRVPATEAEYENYLSQDGAVVITPKGRLLGMGTYFRGGPGGRKATAAWLPDVIDKCMTIVTSQDGPIYLHWVPKEGTAKEVKGVRLDFLPTCESKPIELDPEKEQKDEDVGLPDLA